MAKAKKENVDLAARQQALEEENQKLRQKIAEQEQLRADQAKILGGSILSEMQKIRNRAMPTMDTILVHEINDHKNISLWDKEGNRIGPMHPDNAINTLNKFANMGIFLIADRPSEAEIEVYKQSAEYKEKMKKEAERRAVKNKSRKAGQLERLAGEIAKMSGTTVEAINHILKAHEVKSPAAVR